MKKRTSELAIPRSVKEAVADRDSCDGWPCCILCGKPAPTANPLAFSCAHYISRAQGGLGAEQNILTLCPVCHRRYDSTTERKALRPVLRRYLMDAYPGWDETKIVYGGKP